MVRVDSCVADSDFTVARFRAFSNQRETPCEQLNFLSFTAYATGGYSYQKIADYFGVHFTTVGRIVRGGGDAGCYYYRPDPVVKMQRLGISIFKSKGVSMKWLAYISWLIVWFLIFAFVFRPIIYGGHGGIVSGVAAVINVGIAVFGFKLISRKFKKPVVEDKKS